MKMAKATPQDMQQAFDLLAALDQVAGGYVYMPNADGDAEPPEFDSSNKDHLLGFYQQVMRIYRQRPSGLNRVVYGMDVVLDPANEIVDQNSTSLELHPLIVEAQEFVKRAAELGGLRGLDTVERVRFYEHDFYPLSNFSAFRLMWKGIDFDTLEHAYHWEKFNGVAPEVQVAIMAARSAHEAFKIAEADKNKRRADWDDIKVPMMADLVHAKRVQHHYVWKKLLATGDRLLVEDSWRDGFWGWGEDGTGRNELGKIWMAERAAIETESMEAPRSIQVALSRHHGSVTDYPLVALVKNALRATHSRDIGVSRPRWACTMDTFALGRTCANELCRIHGFDPDEMLAGPVCEACAEAAAEEDEEIGRNPEEQERDHQALWPECSGDPTSCPENEGHGCCERHEKVAP